MGCESTKNTYVDNRLLDDLFEKFNLATYEPIQEFHRMERLWRLHRHWQPIWDRGKQNTPVFYLCFNTNDGFSCHHLPGACFLEKHQEIYMGDKEKSVVLSLNNKRLPRFNRGSLYIFKEKNISSISSYGIQDYCSVFCFSSIFFFRFLLIYKSYPIRAR